MTREQYQWVIIDEDVEFNFLSHFISHSFNNTTFASNFLLCFYIKCGSCSLNSRMPPTSNQTKYDNSTSHGKKHPCHSPIHFSTCIHQKLNYRTSSGVCTRGRQKPSRQQQLTLPLDASFVSIVNAQSAFAFRNPRGVPVSFETCALPLSPRSTEDRLTREFEPAFHSNVR